MRTKKQLSQIRKRDMERELETERRKNALLDSSPLPKCKSLACSMCENAVYAKVDNGRVFILGCGAHVDCPDFKRIRNGRDFSEAADMSAVAKAILENQSANESAITDDMLRKCAKVMVGHLADANHWTRKRMTDKKQIALAAYHGMREALEALGIRVVCVIPECYCTAVEIGDLCFPVRADG